jgi:hypothetical protein
VRGGAVSVGLIFLVVLVYVLGFLSGIGFGLYVISRLLPSPTPIKGP